MIFCGISSTPVAVARSRLSGRGQQHPDGQAPDDARSPLVLQAEGFHSRGNDPGNPTSSTASCVCSIMIICQVYWYIYSHPNCFICPSTPIPSPVVTQIRGHKVGSSPPFPPRCVLCIRFRREPTQPHHVIVISGRLVEP